MNSTPEFLVFLLFIFSAFRQKKRKKYINQNENTACSRIWKIQEIWKIWEIWKHLKPLSLSLLCQRIQILPPMKVPQSMRSVMKYKKWRLICADYLLGSSCKQLGGVGKVSRWKKEKTVRKISSGNESDYKAEMRAEMKESVHYVHYGRYWWRLCSNFPYQRHNKWILMELLIRKMSIKRRRISNLHFGVMFPVGSWKLSFTLIALCPFEPF